MKRLVIDNVILNYLIQPPHQFRQIYVGAAQRLRDEVRNGNVEIIGSVPLFEEIIGACQKLPEKGGKMYKLYYDAIRGRLQKPWNKRVSEELRKGRALTEEEALFGTVIFPEAKRTIQDQDRIKRISDEAKETKHQYKSGWDVVYGRLKEAVSAHEEDEAREGREFSAQQELYKFFWELPDFIETNIKEYWSKHPKASATLPNLRELPSFYAYHLFMYVKTYEHLSFGIEAEEGDWYDLSHFVDAWGADYFVTEDKKLIKTCHRISLIADPPFKVLGSEEFVAFLHPRAD